MARAKKTDKYADIISKLSADELKVLITEAKYALAEIERADYKEVKLEEATKKRDKLRIGDIVSISMRGGEISGTVIGITVDKIQLDTDGQKKSFSILKLI